MTDTPVHPVDERIPTPRLAALGFQIAKYGRGFVANISVLLGIVIGGVVAAALGKMSFGKVAGAHWFDVVLPFSFGMPTFDPVLIGTMVLVMIVTFVAVSISAGMIPLVAPAWTQHMAHGLHPLLESGILLTTISAVLLNMFFNGAQGSEAEARQAAMQAEGGH